MYFGNCCIPSCHTEATNYRQHLLKRVVQCEPLPQPSCLYTVCIRYCPPLLSNSFLDCLHVWLELPELSTMSSYEDG